MAAANSGSVGRGKPFKVAEEENPPETKPE